MSDAIPHTGEEWLEKYGITLYAGDMEINFHKDRGRTRATIGLSAGYSHHSASLLPGLLTVRLNLEDAKKLGRDIVKRKTTEQLNEGWPVEDDRAAALRDYFNLEQEDGDSDGI